MQMGMMMVDGKRTGPFCYMNAESQVILEGLLEDGLRQGLWKLYDHGVAYEFMYNRGRLSREMNQNSPIAFATCPTMFENMACSYLSVWERVVKQSAARMQHDITYTCTCSNCKAEGKTVTMSALATKMFSVTCSQCGWELRL